MTDRTYIAIDLKSFYASVECMDRNLDPMTTNLVVADESRTFDDWSSWYFPNGRFETEQIREIFELAGVHIYSKDFEDIIVGNFGTAIHTAHGGKGTVCLRNGEICNVDLPADSTVIIG